MSRRRKASEVWDRLAIEAGQDHVLEGPRADAPVLASHPT
jgi:hypothetical protein